MTSWDYIIVGAGSAGCALAHVLGNAGRKILVLEAGGSDRSPFIAVTAGQPRACAQHDWGYWSEADPSRNGARENWIRGRVLGGCSSINGTLFARGTSEDYDAWNLPGWSWQDVLPLFREYESSDQSGASRGSRGPLHVRTVRRPHAISKAFVDAARAAGHAFIPDYNGERHEGVAYAQLSQRCGFRCSAADAFLKPLRRTSNVELVPDALVCKVEVVQRRATAVCYLRGGRLHRATAGGIILCAGAINTPQLLMLSGIGDRGQLEQQGIETTLDLPSVGRNLREQPLLTLSYRSRIPTYNLTGGLRQRLAIAAAFLRHGEGPISNIFEATAFLRTAAAQPVTDIQLLFLPFGFVRTPGSFALAPYPSAEVLLITSHPRSSGRILLKSSDPRDPPVIECRLLEYPEDLETLVRGVHAVRTIMTHEPIASLIEAEITPGARIDGAHALRDYVRAHTAISQHAIGTCRMGATPDAVVNPEMCVRGIESLWIADASILQRIPAAIRTQCA